MTGTKKITPPACALAQELETYAGQWSERTGIALETWALPAADVPERVTRGVLAVVHEALANVERHSGASSVSLAVTVGKSGLRMTISDNGAGYTSADPGSGFTAMRDAFAAIGGNLSIHSVPREGTTISGTVSDLR
ncbi:hypothetical protein AB0L05_11365 [Nonomuraea pusilla]|uniref:sensor histidine kinase n=1 Tax=Nonomuraea pusilla TaxID=46177 RepID=UPI0033237F56